MSNQRQSIMVVMAQKGRKQTYLFPCKLLSFCWALPLSPALLRLYQIPVVDRYLTHNLFPFSESGPYTYMSEMTLFIFFCLALGRGGLVQARAADPSLANQNPSPGFFRLHYAKGLHASLVVEEAQQLFMATFYAISSYLNLTWYNIFLKNSIRF